MDCSLSTLQDEPKSKALLCPAGSSASLQVRGSGGTGFAPGLVKAVLQETLYNTRPHPACTHMKLLRT